MQSYLDRVYVWVSPCLFIVVAGICHSDSRVVEASVRSLRTVYESSCVPVIEVSLFRVYASLSFLFCSVDVKVQSFIRIVYSSSATDSCINLINNSNWDSRLPKSVKSKDKLLKEKERNGVFSMVRARSAQLISKVLMKLEEWRSLKFTLARMFYQQDAIIYNFKANTHSWSSCGASKI